MSAIRARIIAQINTLPQICNTGKAQLRAVISNILLQLTGKDLNYTEPTRVALGQVYSRNKELFVVTAAQAGATYVGDAKLVNPFNGIVASGVRLNDYSVPAELERQGFKFAAVNLTGLADTLKAS